MKTLGFSRYALSGAFVALLAGCGASQPSLGAPGPMPQTLALATHADRGTSWMLPEAKRADLLYVSDAANSAVYALSYPDGNLVGTLTGFNFPRGLCIDKRADVWITEESQTYGQGLLVEYKHGGTSPMRTLTDPSVPTQCAVDPKSGDLAVANGVEGNSSLAVFTRARGEAVVYGSPYFGGFIGCTYDNADNLYIASLHGTFPTTVLWLPKGGSTITEFPMMPKFDAFPNLGIQWDGTYLVSEDRFSKIYQFTLQSGFGEKHHRIQLDGDGGPLLWIQGSTIVGAGANLITLWPYPGGGNPTNEIAEPYISTVNGVTVSLALK